MTADDDDDAAAATTSGTGLVEGGQYFCEDVVKWSGLTRCVQYI